MTLQDWNERYRSNEGCAKPDGQAALLLMEWASRLSPGRALDLACGSGRNAGYLSALGWEVTAVDGASVAIDLVRSTHPSVHARVADLEAGEFRIDPQAWDLIVMSYYLQRDLFPAIKTGVRPGGTVLAIVHTPRPDEAPACKRAAPGELRGFFADWEVLHDYEGESRDPFHHRPVAEIVARKPLNPNRLHE